MIKRIGITVIITVLGCSVWLQRLEAEEPNPTTANASPIEVMPGLEAALAPDAEPEGDRKYLEIHRQLESEQRDPDWSDRIESELRPYIQDKSAPERWQIGVLDCRLTACEIQATLAEDQVPVAMPVLQSALEKVGGKYLKTDFDDLVHTTLMMRGGKAWMISFLKRRANGPAPQLIGE